MIKVNTGKLTLLGALSVWFNIFDNHSILLAFLNECRSFVIATVEKLCIFILNFVSFFVLIAAFLSGTIVKNSKRH